MSNKKECEPKISKMLHALGVKGENKVAKYGKVYHLSYRNYFSVGESGDKDWEELEQLKCAVSEESRSGGRCYYVTRAGIRYLENTLGIIIPQEGDREENYPIDEAERKEIRDIWEALKDADIYTQPSKGRLDVEIISSSPELSDMLSEFGYCEYEIPCKLIDEGIVVRFSDLLSFRASGEQILELAPEEMRDEF